MSILPARCHSFVLRSWRPGRISMVKSCVFAHFHSHDLPYSAWVFSPLASAFFSWRRTHQRQQCKAMSLSRAANNPAPHTWVRRRPSTFRPPGREIFSAAVICKCIVPDVLTAFRSPAPSLSSRPFSPPSALFPTKIWLHRDLWAGFPSTSHCLILRPGVRNDCSRARNWRLNSR